MIEARVLLQEHEIPLGIPLLVEHALEIDEVAVLPQEDGVFELRIAFELLQLQRGPGSCLLYTSRCV